MGDQTRGKAAFTFVTVLLMAVLSIVGFGASVAFAAPAIGSESLITSGTSRTSGRVHGFTGSQVVFSRFAEDTLARELWAYDLESGVETRLDVFEGLGYYVSLEDIAVSDEWIVWRESDGTTSGVFAYRVSTGTRSKVLSDGSEMALSGNRMVWVQQLEGSGPRQVFVGDLLTGAKFRISPSSADQSGPDIDGDWVIWQDERYTGRSRIMLRNASTLLYRHPRLLDDYDYYAPSISGGKATWEGSGVLAGINDVFVYDLDTGALTNVTRATSASDKSSPRISGGRIVFISQDQWDRTVWAYDIRTRVTRRLSRDGAQPIDLFISGDSVVWQELGNEDGSAEHGIWLFDLSKGMPPAAPLVGNPTAPVAARAGNVMRAGRYYTVQGTLKPRYPAGSIVRVYLWKYPDNPFLPKIPRGYRTARVSDYGTYSKYSCSVKLPRGTWMMRAYVLPQGGHPGTWSSGSYTVWVP